MNLNATIMKALRAVAAGRVERVYKAHGNVFKAAGTTSPTTLWRCEEAGLIEDGPTISGGMEITVRMKLTAKGLEALT